MYNLGLKLWSTNTDNYLYEAIRLYENNIYDYIELYIVPDTLKSLNSWEIVKRNHNIPFIIHCPHFAHGFNLAKRGKKESNFEIYKQVKEFTDKLNSKYIIFHGGVDGEIKETAEQLASFNEKRALIENKPYKAIPQMGGDFCRGYNIEEIKFVKDTAKCGVCLDIGHACCSAISQGKNIYDYCTEFLSLSPKMFHLTDNKDITSPYDSHLHLGEGQLDLKLIKQILPNDAIITLETIKNSKSDLNDFINDIEYFRGIF